MKKLTLLALIALSTGLNASEGAMTPAHRSQIVFSKMKSYKPSASASIAGIAVLAGLMSNDKGLKSFLTIPAAALYTYGLFQMSYNSLQKNFQEINTELENEDNSINGRIKNTTKAICTSFGPGYIISTFLTPFLVSTYGGYQAFQNTKTFWTTPDVQQVQTCTIEEINEEEGLPELTAPTQQALPGLPDYNELYPNTDELN